jgi:hypothetical protein
MKNLTDSLTFEERQAIINLFERVQLKYENIASNAESEGKPDKIVMYNYGVADGINHCMKMINGVKDDYLDGIE